MQETPSYLELENRIKILESKIINLYTTSGSNSSIGFWSELFNLFDSIIILTDSDNNIENINTKGLEFFNKSKGDVIGKKCKEIFPDHQLSCPICLANESLKEGNIKKQKLFLKNLSSTFETRAIPLSNEENQQTHVLSIIKDISLLVKNEDDLKNRLDQISSTINSIGFSIMVTDLGGTILSLNSKAQHLIRISEKEALGKQIKGFLKLISTNDNRDLLDFNKEVFPLLNQNLVDEEAELIAFDNTKHQVLVNIVPNKDNNLVVNGYIISLIDITSLIFDELSEKETEERLKLMFEFTRNSILKESEKLLKARIESNLNYSIDLNKFKLTDVIDFESLQRLQDDFAFSNHLYSRITDLDDFLITQPSNFSHICKILSQSTNQLKSCPFLQNYSSLSKSYQDILETEKCAICSINESTAPIIIGGKHVANWTIGFFNTENLTEGKLIQLSQEFNININEIKHAIKKTVKHDLKTVEKITNMQWNLAKEVSNLGYSIIRMSQELTERKKFETSLVEAKQVAEESDKMKTAFLASMSHEIRTPMNAIIGFSDLLLDPDFTAEEKEEFINLINSNGEILLRLIDDIIDIAKIEAGELKIDKGDCHVNQVINETIFSAKDNLKKAGKEVVEIRFIDPYPGREFATKTDTARFTQILTNLVGNAQKFTLNGFIEVGYQLKNNEVISGNEMYLQFYVKDTGIGISPEKREIIFNRFKQADDTVSKKFGGTGLGLTISKKLVNLLGGDIWVDSTVGKGTTFYFTIPYEPVNIEFGENVTSLKPYEKIDFTGKTLLIVEDIESNFFLLNTMLSKLNATVIWAKNGQQAVDICRSKLVDLIVMDIKLPELDGFNATQRIKDMYKTLPVIAVTAYAKEEDKLKSLKAGCDDYLSKPVKLELLIGMIDFHLNKVN